MRYRSLDTVTLFLCLLVGGCASLGSHSVKLRADHHASMRTAGGGTRSIEAGEVVELPPEDFVVIEAAGRTSAYILPSSSVSEIKLSLKPQDATLSPNLLRELGNLLSAVENLSDKVEQSLLVAANEEIRSFKARYPEFAYVGFLEASVRLIEGNRAESLEALTQALKSHPEHRRGRELYKELTGSDWDATSASEPASEVQSAPASEESEVAP